MAWYDAGGSLLRIIERRDVVGPELTVEERTRTQERVNADAERFDLSATERFRVPDRKAPLSRLFFDEAGRLWVQFSLRQGDPRKADVYAPDGTLAFTAEWPANISLDLPARVGETAALGIATDSLGVQRIVRMPIR